MKKNFIFFALAASCVLFFASCATVKKMETVKTRDVIGSEVVYMPTVATLEVSQTKVTELFTIKAKSKIKDADKAFAVAKLLTKHNADVLVEPRFSIEEITSGKTTTYNVIVSGYPATYKNFRPLTPADMELLKFVPASSEPQKVMGTFELE